MTAAVLGLAVACGPGPATGPRAPSTGTPPPSEAPATPAGVTSSSTEDRTVVVARHGAVELLVPSAYALLVGFHESEGAALDLEVLAQVAADHAGAGVPAESADGDGVTVIVLPVRQRGTDPTTAMDVVVPAGRAIVAPLDGTVVAVEDYALYGRLEDRRIVIRAAADPTVEAVLLHVEDVVVAPGDRVRAGETVVAGSARILPEASQIDRYTRRSVREDAPPHVHVELRPR